MKIVPDDVRNVINFARINRQVLRQSLNVNVHPIGSLSFSTIEVRVLSTLVAYDCITQVFPSGTRSRKTWLPFLYVQAKLASYRSFERLEARSYDNPVRLLRTDLFWFKE